MEKVVKITVDGPNPIGEYSAWVGDFDIGVTIGIGKTEWEAIADLMERLIE